LGKGVVVGYAIIVPAILLTYLLGANLTILVRVLMVWRRDTQRKDTKNSDIWSNDTQHSA
jgi:hypothetical protein